MAPDGHLGSVEGIKRVVEAILPAADHLGSPARFAFIPALLLGDHRIQQTDRQSGVARHGSPLPNAVGQPVGVNQRTLFAHPEPETRVVVEILRIANPAPFGEVEFRRHVDGVEATGPRHAGGKLCYDPADGCFSEVLSVGPPAEPVGFFELFVGAFEEGDIRGKEIPCLGVGNRVFVKFVVIGIELLDERFEGFGVQNRSMVQRKRGDQGHGKKGAEMRESIVHGERSNF